MKTAPPPVSRPQLRTEVICLALLLIHTAAQALIGTQYQMVLGNPSGATADTNNHAHYLIERSVEALDYSDNLGLPVWASWDLTAEDIGTECAVHVRHR